MSESLDLRLVPAAAAAWAGAVLAVLAPGRVTAAVALAGGGAVVVLVVPALRRRRGPTTPHLAAAALALVVLLAVLVAGAAQRHARDGGPLAAAAASGWTATVRGTVVDEPVPLPPSWPGAEPQVRYTLTVAQLDARGRTTSARGPLVVLGSGDPPVVGATVAVTGRLQPVTSRADRGVAVLVAGGAPVVLREPGGLRRWVGAVRQAARAVVARVPGDAGGLLLGVALGDTSRVDQGLSQALAVAGLTHLVAVSGAHFAIIGALVAAGAAACRAPRAGQAVAVLAAGALLVLLVGPQPSVLRAAVMGSVALTGLLAGRPSRAPAALATAVVALLLADPWLALELGFVLSVVATAAIVLLGGAWTQRWSHRLGRGPAAALATPLAAQLACAPVLLVVRPQVGLYAVLANLLVAPAVGPATVLGVAAALVAPVWPGAASLLAHLGGAACWWVAVVGRTVAAAPGAALPWAPGWLGVVALGATSTGAAALLLRAGGAADAR